ncbi:transcriptional regulator [Halobacterium noricense]|uniref:transcriptional regulator n=1 Tax=Halobacterium noricense TaxID=223182 RepID=UPI001E53353F|nr:transcriptional regulator [Halobacterium noricense]UHH25532.1 transcriptional regulator [Halobacterium noricense]
MPDEAERDGLSDEELDRYGYVSSSQRRVAVVTTLKDSPRTPKQISEHTDIRLNHVSNVLAELADEDVVTCVNPDRKRGRVYRLTELGDTVSAEVASR